MKKSFKKLLALFLTGTMLAGVGCKDYDDDINNLQKEVDDLKGLIELKADAEAFNSLKVGSINSIFYFLHKAAEPFNCLEQDNLA